MSFYARMEGVIQYPSKKEFYTMYKILRKGHWCDAEGYFLDEGGSTMSCEPTIDFRNLRIEIPQGYYRNLARVEFFKTGGKGYILGTSTDGVCMGWIQTENQEKHYDLVAWAKEFLNETDIPDFIKEFDHFYEWQAVIENDFFEEFSEKLFATSSSSC